MNQKINETINNINKKKIISLFISVVLVLSLVAMFAFPKNVARADDVEAASGSLEQAQAQLDSVANDYNNAMAQAQSLEAEKQEATTAALNAQKQLATQQKELAEFARANYRNSSSLPYLTVIFAAESFEDFVKNLDYANRYVKSMMDAVKDQREAKEQFDNTLEELNAKSDAYNAAVSEANAKLAEANALVDSARQNLANAEEAQKLANQVQQVQQESPAPAPQPVPEEGGTWKSGSASAYGGSTDPGCGTTTATGAQITDNSMGVAIPMSWANYSSYFNKTIQIKVGGTVVLATINDCGGLGGRDLDLQPGVFKSFGYQSCSAWGVRSVEYKIL